MKQIPESIRQTLTDLAPDAIVQLFQIKIPGEATLYLSPQIEVRWLGNTYEQLPINLSELSYESNGRLNRPKLTIANPNGLFSADVAAGRMDTAEITRIRILRKDLEDNLDYAIRDTLNVGRVISMTHQNLVIELRDALDGNLFQVPARRYMPPEFPHVRLG